MRWQLLHKACWEGDAATVAALLRAGANPNQVAPTNWRQTPLGRTLEFRITAPRHEGHVETVRVLLAAGADPLVRSTTLDLTPWELATFCGLVPAADLLGSFGTAPPHPTGMTGLWLAAASRFPESAALEALEPWLGSDGLNTVWRQATPLMMAAGHAGHFRVCERLLAAGADPNAGTSILHASCSWHFQYLVPAIRFLAAAGWDVNQRDAAGQTALHKARFLRYTGAIRALLEAGADPSLLND